MVTKELLKTYNEKRCPKLVWLLSNEKSALSLYEEIVTNNFKIDIEDFEGSNEQILSILKDNKELIPLIKEKINNSELDLVTKTINQMQDLHEISLAAMKYFFLKYEGKVKRADTLDGKLNGLELYSQEKIKQNTEDFLQDNEVKVILEGQIDYKNYRARWDALVKNEDGTISIYEIKGLNKVFNNENKTSLKTNIELDLLFQYFVYKDYFKNNLKNISLMHLNGDFCYYDSPEYPLNDEKLFDLFIIEDYIYDNNYKILLKDYLESQIPNLLELLNQINQYTSLAKEPNCFMQYACKKGGQCCLFSNCLKINGYPEKENIFQLTSSVNFGGSSKKSKVLIEDLKLKSIKEIPNDLLEKSFPSFNKKSNKRSIARLQIDYAKLDNNQDFVSLKEIKDLLAKDYATFPLVFFDFETFSNPLPIVNNQRPWEPICSQYSMHILKENYLLEEHDYDKGEGGNIYHYQFIGNPRIDKTDNPEIPLINTMLEQFKKEAINWKNKQFTIIAYNKRFEQTQFARMAEKYPQYKEFLNICHDRTVDLMDFFSNCYFYKRDYNGKISLKVITPNMQKDKNIMSFYNNLKFDINDTLNYHTAEDVIFNGQIALDIYKSLIKASLLDKKEVIKYNDYFINGLLKYCKKDSWGTVIIYDILKRITSNIEN